MSSSTPKKEESKGRRRRSNGGTPDRQSNEGSTPRRQPKGHRTPNRRSNCQQNNQQSPSTVRGTPKKNDFKPFPSYFTSEAVSDGLKRGTLLKGLLRINQRKYEEAFIDSLDGYGDIHIKGMIARNRALHGDEVIVELLPKDQWEVDIEAFEASQDKIEAVSTSMETLTLGGKETCSDETTGGDAACDEDSIKKRLFAGTPIKEAIPEKFFEKFGKVVYISQKNHSRAAGGHLKPPTKTAVDALFSPNDPRIPRMYIPVSECPEGFLDRPDDFAKFLFIARIKDWDSNKALPKGCLQRSLGEAGQIEPETEAILIEHGVDFSEFSDEVLACLPQGENWSIPEDEIAKRRDLRKECIFTIDPATARDLDDALSCKETDDGNFEVGVHIADVSYFIPEKCALDEVASQRATSVYLVQKVIPMLPRLLCEKLCSLNPYQDRLAFSFIWTLTPDGIIENEWCGRTVIRSCVKLSYAHAQDMIEHPDKEFADGELPEISNRYGVEDVKRSVLNLQKIANRLRQKRFEEGALRLDQVKLSFTIDKETGLPSGYSVYQLRDSNRLVEEFMLLANMAAAVRIYQSFPKQALLRRHSEPKQKMIEQLVDMCAEMGLSIDATTAGTIQESLQMYTGEDAYSKARTQILVNLCSKPMQLAKYFCTGLVPDENAYRHYALNVPFYTHFTSPIRRYADIIVHRLLAASVYAAAAPTRDAQVIELQAKHCNERKTASKKVQEMSAEMFLAVYIKECGPLEENGMVMAVLDRSVDVLILSIGVVKRVYCNATEIADKVSYKFSKNGKCPQLNLVWAADEKNAAETKQEVKVFSTVKVILTAGDQDLKFKAILKRPEDI
ncbi:DIS3-like exonuclease 2 isoform X2 [Anneissia japonica]|nr:DIS3-like exonuclease 2 isoform X2 [Anneissia japonica]XP_033115209.1 DIS3-like exonuclease 2 isoform X2 [Anneissia japonica]